MGVGIGGGGWSGGWHWWWRVSVMTYYKRYTAVARDSGINESASMCCLMGPDILQITRRAAAWNPLAEVFQPRLVGGNKKGSYRAPSRILESTQVKQWLLTYYPRAAGDKVGPGSIPGGVQLFRPITIDNHKWSSANHHRGLRSISASLKKTDYRIYLGCLHLS